MPNLATEDLTAIRDLIADYVQPDARQVLAMIDAALAVPATVPGMETRLERWGLPVVDGPSKECSCARMPEGYWTPWHEAQGVVDRHQERIDALAAEVSRLTTKRETVIAIWKERKVRELEAEVSRLTAALAEARQLSASQYAALQAKSVRDGIAREIAAREEERARCMLIAMKYAGSEVQARRAEKEIQS